MEKSWFLGLFLAAVPLYSLPEHPHVQHGTAAIHVNGSDLRVETSSPAAILHWHSFSIGKEETARFVLPHTDAKVLNRVTGPLSSSILGRLESNGKVYLINQNGILVGRDAVIDTKSIVLSTLDISNESFLRGEELRFTGDNDSSIQHLGKIYAEEDILIISKKIENEGLLVSKQGRIGLGAGEEVLLRPSNDSFFILAERGDGEIINAGTCQALQVEIAAAGNPYALAIRQSGKIEANAAVEKNGRIFLVATQGTISVDGTLIAPGGEIKVSADQILAKEEASFNADGTRLGHGGSVVLIGEDLLDFAASATARGGVDGGDGGFIEVSGHRTFFYKPKAIDTSAAHGNTGTLLIDPNDIIIQAALATSGGFANPYNGAGFNPANLQISDLIGASGLLNNNVTVQTSAATVGGNGDITIQDPFSWASNKTLTLLPSRHLNVDAVMQATGSGSIIVTASGGDINVGSTASAVASAIQTTSGSITLTASGNLNVIGGSAAVATSLVGSTGGAITAAIGGSVNVGNAISVAASEISSVTGNVTFTNIGSNLVLQGGSGGGAYAQIGKGIVTGATAIQSNILFTAIGNNVTLTGGSGVSSYAQIGHAPNGPGVSTATGNITFPSGGFLLGTLSGGTNLNASAIIGHGNELSANLAIVSGQISVTSTTGFTLTGGTTSRAHAVIGFHSPQGGSNFTCTSNGVSVQNTGGFPIALVAGTGNNAVIGYYNNTMVGGPSVTINSIAVSNTGTFPINLTAGATGGIGHGVAAIGTLANLGTAQSSVVLTTGFLQCNPVASSGDGSVRIVNNHPGVSAANDVTITCSDAGSPTIILGGSTSTSNFAEIYSSRNLILNLSGEVDINNTLQAGYAQVVANQNISYNTITPLIGKLILAGSNSNGNGYALMQAVNGSLQFGTTFNPGSTGLTIGDPSSMAYSRIASSTSMFMSVAGNALLSGGTGGFMATAEIRNNTGGITLDAVKLTLNGGGGNLCYAQIGSTSGDITTTLFSDLTLQGGAGTQAYAQIGKGYITTETAINSNVLFNQIQGNVSITGGGGVGAYAQIGHSPFNTASSINVQGDINLGIVGITGSLSLQGGTASQSTAIFGHGNELSVQLANCTGNLLNFVVTQNISLQAGTKPKTHAIIGYCNPTGGSSALFTVSAMTGMQINCTSGMITGTATDGSNAVIGYYNASNGASAPFVTVNLIDLKCTNDIFFQAGNNGGTGAGVAAIGTLADSGQSHSNITIKGQTITFNGPVGLDDGAARLVNSLAVGSNSAPYDVTVTATDLNFFGGTGSPNGFADGFSSRDFLCDFTNNFQVNKNTPLQNGYAQVLAYNDINLSTHGTQMSVIGGANFGAYALIQSTNGDVLHGSFPGSGVNFINVGDVTSLSTSKIVTSSGQLNVNSTLDFKVQAGTGANCVSLLQTTSGPFSVSAGGTLSFTGGNSGANASAEIRSQSGPGQVAAGLDLLLTGGGGTLCFAQIDSDQANITFTNVGRDLKLTGGSALQAYAQIGKGYVPDTTTAFTSTLIFNNIGSDITLTGGSATQTYVQIGHSPFGSSSTLSVLGDVNIQSSGGTVTLNGGSAQGTTAIIGHGNEWTTMLGNCTASVSVFNEGIGGISLNPGASGLDTHTVIGFHSPKGGPAMGITFRVISDLIDVETEAGPILINGGAGGSTGENAIIGYYNITTPLTLPPGVNVNLKNLTVKCSNSPFASNRITLQAGNTLAGVNGIAIIGSVVAPGSTAISTINVSGNALNVLGPTGTNDSQAIITNNTIGSIFPLNVTLNTNTTTVYGGTTTSASTNPLAEIYSSAVLTCNFQTGLNVGINPASPATLATKNSLIRAFTNINMNQGGSNGNIQILGGASAAVLSDISSFAGDISIGATNIPGANNVTIGRSDMIGSARIFTVTGDITAQANGDLTVNGGAAATAIADIDGHHSLTFQTNGNITVNGSALALARLAGGSGDVFVAAKKAVTLTGNAPATVTNFGFGNGTLTVVAGTDITLNLDSDITNSGNGTTVVNANNDLILNSNGTIQNIGTGALTTFSGVDTILNDTSKITANGGDLTIVVDNLFPTAPNYGLGAFETKAATVTISTTGLVRIFTSVRDQNDINSQINGATFSPGPFDVNTATEQWSTYFPSSIGGVTFTLFYKIPQKPIPPPPTPVPPIPLGPAHRRNSISNIEFLQNIWTYDDLFLGQHEIVISDRELKSLYPFFRQFFRDYNLKKLDLLDVCGEVPAKEIKDL